MNKKIEITSPLMNSYLNKTLESNGWNAVAIREDKDQTGKLIGYICKTDGQNQEFFAPSEKVKFL